MCSVLLVFILSVTGMSESTQSLLNELRKEIGVLNGCLIGIGSELNQMKLYSQSLLESSDLAQKRLKSRIAYLENRQIELQVEKYSLEKECEALSESEGLPDALKSKHLQITKGLQGEINLWRGIAIGSGVLALAAATYIIIRGR